ncbi:thioesterase family protein [Oceanicella actignis]|uniref:Acyl-CoA thioester hydrolase n=1 Tax=Oceanicella actignis TaxID=1189325 RepID=A0A1M7SAR6_9RHOB|nr:thioesterase family protein [Oceanicella actignis]TYO91545.1 acyl-CoA thioester hydrolase [Oceanicella actignis]SET28855.1 acyl-CoA thioester hydrolase [Oceanicella actignis]SHN55576.1 acyl-CoA thioester hydrolase [Oceanicella actignis]
MTDRADAAPQGASGQAPGAGAPVFEAAPIRGPELVVPPEWIDYNGHMNVAYYTMAFDKGADHIFDEVLGIGEAYARDHRMGPYVVQQTLHYVGELLEGERFFIEMRLLDHDEKKLHLYMEMKRASDGSLRATTEQLVVNVDLERRRSTPYPDWALARIRALAEAQAGLPRPERAGASVGIRRKG